MEKILTTSQNKLNIKGLSVIALSLTILYMLGFTLFSFLRATTNQMSFTFSRDFIAELLSSSIDVFLFILPLGAIVWFLKYKKE